jgi:hypothetical protein
VAREDERGPRHVSWSLSRIASKVTRVDLTGFAAVEAVWVEVAAAVASSSVPTRVAGGVLTVRVPSGAHAARAKLDAPRMLGELAALVRDPPRQLRVVVMPAR